MGHGCDCVEDVISIENQSCLSCRTRIQWWPTGRQIGSLGVQTHRVLPAHSCPFTFLQVPQEKRGEERMAEQVVDSSSSGTRFTPLVALELASDTKEEAIAWLLSRIRDKQQNGGGQIADEAVAVAATRPSFGVSSCSARLCQVLIFWWSSWALELEIRRKKTQTCS